MNHPNRDFKKPVSYCCQKMDYELLKGDMVDYTWHTRDYIIRSSTAPQIWSIIDFCPWCGKYIGGDSLYD